MLAILMHMLPMTMAIVFIQQMHLLIVLEIVFLILTASESAMDRVVSLDPAKNTAIFLKRTPAVFAMVIIVLVVDVCLGKHVTFSNTTKSMTIPASFLQAMTSTVRIVV
jgi:hypothetical protein